MCFVVFAADVVHPRDPAEHLCASRRERQDIAQFEDATIGDLAFARSQSELLRASQAADGDQRKFQLQTLVAFRTARQEGEGVRCDVDRFPRREVIDGAACSLGVVAQGRCMSETRLVLRCQLRSSHRDASGAAVFERGSNASVHLHSCRCALALIEDVSIQGVAERVTRVERAVRQIHDGDVLQPVLALREIVALPCDGLQILSEHLGQGGRAKLYAAEARGFEQVAVLRGASRAMCFSIAPARLSGTDHAVDCEPATRSSMTFARNNGKPPV